VQQNRLILLNHNGKINSRPFRVYPKGCFALNSLILLAPQVGFELHLDQGTSLPVATWRAQIGDPTIADSILDRLVHNVHRIEMQGGSMRKRRGGKNGKEA
jgi:hypothetical protein